MDVASSDWNFWKSVSGRLEISGAAAISAFKSVDPDRMMLSSRAMVFSEGTSGGGVIVSGHARNSRKPSQQKTF